MRGRRRLVKPTFGGTRRLSFCSGLVGRRTLLIFRGASMGRDNRRNEVERLARLMPAGAFAATCLSCEPKAVGRSETDCQRQPEG